jgi:hypothetical protein
MKEIDQYASMGFAIDIGKGVDITKETASPQESRDYDQQQLQNSNGFKKFKPVLGVGYSSRIRKSSHNNYPVDPMSRTSS